MSDKDKKENGKSLAAEIYKNTKMGADSITDLIGHVENEKLRVEMTSELDRYEELASRAAKLSRDRGEEPKEEGALAKAAVKMSMAVNTMTDSSASHIAEMMMQGSMITPENIRPIRYTPSSREAKMARTGMGSDSSRSLSLA